MLSPPFQFKTGGGTGGRLETNEVTDKVHVIVMTLILNFFIRNACLKRAN